VGCKREVLYPYWRSNLSLHEVWYYITSGCFQNPHQSTCLMLDCLPRKRRYACCCCKELLVLGFVPCWRLVHTLYFRHPLVLFLFFSYHLIGLTYTLCGFSGLGLCPPNFFFNIFFPFFNNIYEHLTRTEICKTPQFSWNVFYSFYVIVLSIYQKKMYCLTCHITPLISYYWWQVILRYS